jgi:cytochrome c-type biogenesis protein CcmH/NrfG
MLMRIREQKGWIRGIFVALIVVFASSFVIGGVGSGGNFSLSDIIGNGGGSSSSTDTGSVTSLLKQVTLHPKDGAAWSQLSEAYSAADEPDKAITAGEKAAKLRPQNVDGQKSLASLYQAKASSLNSQAQTVYNEAYTLQQESPDASPFNAVASTSPIASAIESPFDKSQSNDLTVQVSSLEDQSQTLASQAQTWNTKALAEYKTIVNNHVNDAQSWLSYATTAEQIGNNTAALLGYQTFLKLVPSDPIAPQVKAKVKSLKATIKKAAAGGTTTSGSSTTGTTTSTTGG